MICLTCDRQGGRGKESPHPRPTKRQCSAGGGNHHKVSFHARELAPKGDNLIHAHVSSYQEARLLNETLQGVLLGSPNHPQPAGAGLVGCQLCWLARAGWVKAVGCPLLASPSALPGPGPPPAAGSSRPPCSSASSRSPWPAPGSPRGRHVCPPAPACSPSSGPGVGRRGLVPPPRPPPLSRIPHPQEPQAAFSLAPYVTNVTVKGQNNKDTRLFHPMSFSHVFDHQDL